MYRDNRLRHRREESESKLLIVYRRKNSLGKIDNLDSQFLDRARKLLGRVAGVFDDLCGSTNQILNATSAQVGFEDPVWVVEITDDQIEAREIVGQFRRQFRIA